MVRRHEGGILVPVKTWSPGTLKSPNPYFVANASLASQAVEPPVSDVEMSYRGRMFHHIARRMLKEQILRGQEIAEDDSGLSDYARPETRPTYEALIKEVFVDAWWDGGDDCVEMPCEPLPEEEAEFRTLAAERHSHMESNFSLFWGLALHVYQSTLVSDDAPFDREERDLESEGLVRERDGRGRLSRLSDAARRGRDVFRNAGCAECHAGAEFTSASLSEIGLLGRDGRPVFPDLIGEEGDIVVGEEFGPKAPPVGVECMDLGGRFDSIYDVGNYVVGVSRYERRSGFPAAPPVRGGGLVERFLFAPDAAHWEDGGNGREFVPPEEQLTGGRHFTDVSTLQRARFGQHLAANPEQFDQLRILLGLPIGREKAKVSLSAPDAAEILIRQRKQPERTRLQRQAAAANLPLGATGPLGRGNPLNSTQMIREGVLPDDEDPAAEGAEPSLLPLNVTPAPAAPPRAPARQEKNSPAEAKDEGPADAEAAADGNAAPDEVRKGGNNPWRKIRITFPGKDKEGKNAMITRELVTHMTPVPLRSISREFLPKWEKELRDRDLPVTGRPLSEKISDAGAFKTPTLRNVELTGPYMHNGSLLTLDAVVEFYARGGDFNDRVVADGGDTITGHQHPEMVPIPLSPEQKRDLVEFLKSLTDDRVRRSAAPFDHPSLPLVLGVETPGGAPRDGGAVEYAKTCLPAVGKGGAGPLPTFEAVLRNGGTH